MDTTITTTTSITQPGGLADIENQASKNKKSKSKLTVRPGEPVGVVGYLFGRRLAALGKFVSPLQGRPWNGPRALVDIGDGIMVATGTHFKLLEEGFNPDEITKLDEPHLIADHLRALAGLDVFIAQEAKALLENPIFDAWFGGKTRTLDTLIEGASKALTGPSAHLPDAYDWSKVDFLELVELSKPVTTAGT